MKGEIEIVEPKMFAGVVADEIVATISEAIAERGRCSIALAGGKSPSIVYRALARPPRVEDVDWSKVTLSWGDERWVPRDDNESNFRMVSETLLSNLPKPGPQIVAVDTTLSSPEEAARDYASRLQRAENAKPGDIPQLDLMLLGVGEDGHTASLFPDSPVLSAKGTVAHAVSGLGTMRITLSPDVIRNARRLLFVVRGPAKAEIIRELFEGEPAVNHFPAALANEAAGSVRWFVDSEAAQRLRR